MESLLNSGMGFELSFSVEVGSVEVGSVEVGSVEVGSTVSDFRTALFSLLHTLYKGSCIKS